MELTPVEMNYSPLRSVGRSQHDKIGRTVTADDHHSLVELPLQDLQRLERFVIRLGMCFRVFPDDISVLKQTFPDDIPGFLLREGAETCLRTLERYGFLSAAMGNEETGGYQVPSEVLLRLERTTGERKHGVQTRRVSDRKREHVLLADAFLAQETSIICRRRYLAEALVQLRKARAWDKLEARFQASSIHLFGTHDSYIGRACVDIPEQVVRRHPSLAIATTMAQASAVLEPNQTSLDDSFEQRSGAPFESVESRIDRMIKVYGPLWAKQPTIDGKLLLGIHWIRHHRQRGGIDAARDVVNRILAIMSEHVARGDFPTETNLHWLENERGILEFMGANWSAAYVHHKKTIDMTFSAAVPGQYIPRLACTVSALQQALSGNQQEANTLLRMATSLLDAQGDQEYIEFTLWLVQLILCLDTLDVDGAEVLVRKLERRLFRFEIWAVAVRFMQLFDLLRGRHVANQARLELARSNGPGPQELSPVSLSHVWQARMDTLQALGHIQHARARYETHSSTSTGERLGYARLHYLGGRYDRALRLLSSIVKGNDGIMRDRGAASALMVATYVKLSAAEQAEQSLDHCLDISVEAASLLPIALLPKGVRIEVMKLAKTNPRWSLLADSVGLAVEDMECRFARVGQCFPEEATLVDLTPRELVVLEMLDGEYPQNEIASHLHVALSTIKKQIASIYGKLRVTCRTDALAVAYELGLLGGPDERVAHRN